MRNFETDPLRVAMLGYIPENNHPYSWSAIINGFDPENMARCPAPVIFQYLSKQPPGSVRIPFARVTHLWTDNPSEAAGVAAAACIPRVVTKPEDVLGEVEAIIIATDEGDDHVRRVAPFAESGLPIFVDKPLATNLSDLRQFIAWRKQGAKIISSSGLRYASEVEALRGKNFRWITGTTCKSWARYGIHALEPIYTMVGAGFERIRARQSGSTFLMEGKHRDGTLISIAAMEESYGSAFVFHGYADTEHVTAVVRDNYTAFRHQLMSFLEYASGKKPEAHPFSETVELMTILIAAAQSADRGGVDINPAELLR